MLSSFQIDNFRLFQHLEVRNLRRVNLIVGKNNSGKSAFLEALEIYASNAYAAVLLNLVDTRQETWFSEVKSYPKNGLDHPIRHLFFDRYLPSINQEGILLGEIDSHDKLHISVAAYQNKTDEEGGVRSARISNLKIDEEVSDIDFYLIAEEGHQPRRLFNLAKNGRSIRVWARGLHARQSPELRYVCQIVPTENIPERKLAALWDLTSLTSLESEILDALRLIDNRISGVAFVEDANQGQLSDHRIPLVKMEGIDEPLPLRSMGDGMTRLLHIVVALVNARNGLLLVDEFENGLHWSIQPKVWDIVFQLAERLNVQVFATTHSRDCVGSFNQVWGQYSELGAFFRLGAKDGSIKATEYTLETLADAIEMDVEVR